MADRELILAARAGDTEAFGQLVRKYQRSAYGHALALIGQPEEARDAVQDAFFAAFRALGRIDTERPFFPWLYVILRNRCFSILRARRTMQSLDDACLDVKDVSPTEEIIELRRALGQLPAEDREILVLKYIGGLSYREIAEALGIAVGTVGSRLCMARRRLTEMLLGDRNTEIER